MNQSGSASSQVPGPDRVDDHSSTSRGRRKRLLFSLLSALLVLGIGLALAETALRLAPDLLPEWYRHRFPVGGLELYHPGILARTPIEGVPVPYRVDRDGLVIGSVPRDLEAIGLVDPSENPDRDRYRDLVFPIDQRGFVNSSEPTVTDILLVGDSFAVAAGVTDPRGLQIELSDRLAVSIFNLGIPAIGPIREEWLLSRLGLELAPRAIVWLFFGGNDLADATAEVDRQSRGIRSYAEFFEGPLRPRWYLWDFLRSSMSRSPSSQHSNSLEGFVFESADGPVDVWFNPPYLRALTDNRKRIEESRGWQTIQGVFGRVANLVRNREIPLLMVYVPSKAQVYLEHVVSDVDLGMKMASFGAASPPSSSPGQLWADQMTNKDSLEHLVADHAQRVGFDFVSLTPALRTLAADGDLGYLSGDTHWNEKGQSVAVPVLAAWWMQLAIANDIGDR